VDLLIGVCLTINLGRVPKIHRDTRKRSDRPEGVMAIIDRRMCDAMQSSLPQISVGRINFLSVSPTDLLRPSHHHQHQHGGADRGLEW
jgi:phosphoribulokinase